MKPPKQVDPRRRRSLWSIRLWAAVAVAVLAVVVFEPLSLLWTVNHPIALLLAFPAGHLAFGLSVLTTSLSPRTAWYSMTGSIALFYRPFGGGTMLFYVFVAFAEEVLFRALPFSHSEGAWWQIALLALAFTLIHVRGASRSRLLVLVDFFVFGCLLGALFVWLRDLWPLVIIHWVRNASVAKVFVRKQPAGGQGS